MALNKVRTLGRYVFQITFLATVALLLPAGVASASMINLATNVTVGATASQSSDYGGYPASNAIDGNLGDFSHTAGGGTTDTQPSLTVNLNNTYDLSQIDVYNRGDGCCQYRLTDFQVTVYAANHSTVEFSQLYFPNSGYPNDGTNPNPLVINLPTNTTGQFVEIQKFNNPSNTSNPSPVGSDNVALSLGELQIFGPSIQPVPEPSSLLLCGLGAIGLCVAARRYRRAQASSHAGSFGTRQVAVTCALLSVVVVALAIGSSASAAVINFGAASDFSGPADVNLDGQTTFDRAYDFGAGTLHINGFTFNDFTAQSSDTQSGLGSQYGSYGNGGQSGDYGTLLSNGLYQDGGTSSITFNNLHAGYDYSIGVWVNDSRGCCTDRVETVSGSAGGTTGTLLFGGANTNNANDTNPVGQFVYGTFTATGTSETLNLNLVGTNTGNQQINGVILSYSHPTPEPASFILAGLGAVGLLVAARRRRRA